MANISGDYPQIDLTQGKVAVIDEEDYDKLSKYKWSARWNKHSRTFYALSNEIGSDGKYHTIYMHRFIMETPIGMVVDHLNHDGLDNRKSNLRNVTNLENSRNRRGKNSNNNSGHLGISLDGGKWKAQIQVLGKKMNLGRFNSIEDAVSARKSAENRYFRGEGKGIHGTN